MNEEQFKTACSNYIKSYKEFGKEEFIKRPDNLFGGEYVFKYFIKDKKTTTRKTAKFTYLQRKYFLKNGKMTFKESEKSFSIKLEEESLSKTSSSDKEFIFENYLAIVAYIGMFEITNETFVSELGNYLNLNDQDKSVKHIKEKDSRIGKNVKTLKEIMFKDGLLIKKSVGVVKSVKGDELLVTFKEMFTKKDIDIYVKESNIMYIDGDE